MKKLWLKSKFSLAIVISLLGGLVVGKVTMDKQPEKSASLYVIVNGDSVLVKQGDTLRVKEELMPPAPVELKDSSKVENLP